MTAKRRIISFTGRGARHRAASAAVYYMPQWQQQQRRARRRRGPQARFGGGGPSSDPVPVLASTARGPPTCRSISTASAPRKALNTVTVRSQVDGKLINILFKEGQEVPKGFVLAKIDPVTYQAAYDQTVAKKAQDEAQLANARLDLDRYTRLAATNAVNKQQLDTQKALVAQLEAQVKLGPGRDRQRARHPLLHRHRRTDRRPHRHPAGRRGQSACGRAMRPASS